MESNHDVLLLRSRDYWRGLADRYATCLRETTVRVGAAEIAYESLLAYAQFLEKAVQAVNPEEKGKLLTEMQALCLRDIAYRDYEAAFGGGDSSMIGKDLKRMTEDATAFKMKVDYYRGLERLNELLNLAPDTTLIAAVRSVERLKVDHDKNHQLIVEELVDGNM